MGSGRALRYDPRDFVPMGTTMPGSAFRIELNRFSGPLDLLVYLVVRRNELDVLDVPVAEIARQYLAHLHALGVIDPDEAGEFVVDAGTLVERKSRLVLPTPEEREAEPDAGTAAEPDGELVQRLLQYRKYKEAAESLQQQAAEWQRRYPRLSDERPRQGNDPACDPIREVELWDLISALSRVLRRNVAEDEAHIRYDDTPLSVYMEQIRERVMQEGRVGFTSCFSGETSRSRIVGLFLAILELIRHHAYRAEQPRDFGEIWILPPAETAER
ncbi:MAG: segregation and condensation protein A [Planctomycetaceae bacterium]